MNAPHDPSKAKIDPDAAGATDAEAFVKRLNDLLPKTANGCILLGIQYGENGEFAFEPYIPDGEFPEDATHVNVALFEPDENGAWSNAQRLVTGTLALVLDDVGTKARATAATPTAIIETSAGNDQWWFVYSDSVSPTWGHGTARAAAKAELSDPFIEKQNQYWVRLPGSLPAQKIKQGRTEPARLTTWNGGTYSLTELAIALKLKPNQVETQTYDGTHKFDEASAMQDPVLGWLRSQGKVKESNVGLFDSRGFADVQCPNWEQHSDQNRPWARYVPPNKASNPGFVCHHAHCEGLGLSDLRKGVEAAGGPSEAEARAYVRKLAQPTEDARTRAAEVVSRFKERTVLEDTPQGLTIEDAVIAYRSLGGGFEWTQFVMPDEYEAISAALFDGDNPWHEGMTDDEIDDTRFVYHTGSDIPLDQWPAHIRKMEEEVQAGQAAAEATKQVLNERLAGIEAIKERTEAAKPKPDFELIERVPKGPLKEIVDHCYALLASDTPEIALMAALTGVSATMSGYCAKSNLGHTPVMLWGQALAPTGSGKSYAEDGINQILAAVGISTTTMPKSAEGIHRGMIALKAAENAPFDGEGHTTAVMVIVIDETGYWMANLASGAQATTGTDAAFGAGLSLYNKSIGDKAYIPAAYLAREKDSRPRVDNPALYMAGFSTSKLYMPTLTPQMIEGGWANRTLHYFSDYDCEERSPFHVRPEAMPETAVNALKELQAGCTVIEEVNGKWVDRRKKWGFYKPANFDDHREIRTVQVSVDQLVYARTQLDALREDLKEIEASPALAKRFTENAIKIATIASVLGYAETASVRGKWPLKKLEVSDAHMEWACWTVARLIRTFAHRVSKMPGGAVDQQNAEHIMDIAERGLADPQFGKKRPQWVAALNAGIVPHSFLVHHAKLDATKFKSAMQVLEDVGTVLTVPETDPNIPEKAKPRRGPAPLFYEIMED